MQSLKRPGRSTPKRQQPVVELVPEYVDPDAFDDELDAYDTFEMYRVVCPDCAQPIALLADEEVLPEHALCATPWNPFGLTVCAGTGRSADDARPGGRVRDAPGAGHRPAADAPSGTRLAHPAVLARRRSGFAPDEDPRHAAPRGLSRPRPPRPEPGRPTEALRTRRAHPAYRRTRVTPAGRTATALRGAPPGAGSRTVRGRPFIRSAANARTIRAVGDLPGRSRVAQA